MYLYSNEINYNNQEKIFIDQVLFLVTKYPIIWYDFINTIYKNNIIIVEDNNTIILYEAFSNIRYKDVCFKVFNYFKKSNIFNQEIKQRNFTIYYISSRYVLSFFKKKEEWLKLIIKKAIYDIIGLKMILNVSISNCYIDGYIKMLDNNYLFKCNDSYILNKDEIIDLIDLKNQYNNIVIVYITTKLDYNVMKYLRNNNIIVIKYHQNYYELIKDLKEELKI